MTENYITLAMRTNSPTTGTHGVHPDLLHAALGLADEMFEMYRAYSLEDMTNAVEEMGDFCWFVALAAYHLDCNPFVGFPSAEDLGDANLEDLTHSFISAIKKAYAYGAPLDVAYLRQQLAMMVGCIAVTCGELLSKTSLVELLDRNIKKLRTRYPERFTQDLALNRDLDAEAATLRG